MWSACRNIAAGGLALSTKVKLDQLLALDLFRPMGIDRVFRKVLPLAKARLCTHQRLHSSRRARACLLHTSCQWAACGTVFRRARVPHGLPSKQK